MTVEQIVTLESALRDKLGQDVGVWDVSYSPEDRRYTVIVDIGQDRVRVHQYAGWYDALDLEHLARDAEEIYTGNRKRKMLFMSGRCSSE